MLFAGVSVLLIWWLPASEVTIVALSCFFSGFTIIGWNALDVIEVEYFDTEVRYVYLMYQYMQLKCMHTCTHMHA